MGAAMSEIFYAPPLTVLSSIRELATHLPCIKIEQAEQIPEREFRVSKANDCVRWYQGDAVGVVDIDDILKVNTSPRVHLGRRFLAVALTFRNAGESVRYGLATSPESESKWITETVERVRSLLELPAG
jgi:Leu/Phe-tRNA-protein transferase